LKEGTKGKKRAGNERKIRANIEKEVERRRRGWRRKKKTSKHKLSARVFFEPPRNVADTKRVGFEVAISIEADHCRRGRIDAFVTNFVPVERGGVTSIASSVANRLKGPRRRNTS
jgi:hypothetical protein